MSTTNQKPILKKQNLLLIFSLHLAFYIFYTITYQQSTLVLYPPVFIFWLVVTTFFTLCHHLSFRFIQKHMDSNFLINFLWGFPLLFMGFFICSSLGWFAFTKAMGFSGITRQLLQLNLSNFSHSLYIFYLLIPTSGTMLFANLSWFSLPFLNEVHLNKISRKITRFTLLGLLFMLFCGLFWLIKYEHQNLAYMKAVYFTNLGKKPFKSLQIFKETDFKKDSLKNNSIYRSGRIWMRDLQQWERAIEQFERLLKNKETSLKDDALLQILYCMIQMDKKAPTLLKYWEKHKNESCLNDEMLILIANRFEVEKQPLKAQEIYKRLSQKSWFTFCIKQLSSTSPAKILHVKSYAQEKLN